MGTVGTDDFGFLEGPRQRFVMNGSDLTIVSSRRRAFRDSNQFRAVKAMAMMATTKDATTISSAKMSLGPLIP